MFWVVVFVAGLALALSAYVLALRIKLYAVVDMVWTGGLGLAAIAYYFSQSPDTIRSVVVVGILVFWSGRLSLHILKDRVIPGIEDRRYAALAEHWGDTARQKFIFVFLGQVPLILLFSYAASMAMRNPVDEWRWLDSIGTLIAILALAGEYLADHQLSSFRANPENKGKVCRIGLWRYSRHPNYFFEWLHWFAYVAFALGSSNWWLALLGPVMMYVFLRYLTGIPFAERSSLKSRGDAYRDYQKTTNAFFPWIPQQDRT
jgi:steroid 5-alpha reductase family enzyme